MMHPVLRIVNSQFTNYCHLHPPPSIQRETEQGGSSYGRNGNHVVRSIRCDLLLCGWKIN